MDTQEEKNFKKRALADEESEFSNEEEMEFFEESSESEPELECDSWDADCKVIQKLKQENQILGIHILPTCRRNPDVYPVTKRRKFVFEINHNLTNTLFTDVFKQCWCGTRKLKSTNLELILEPFKVFVVNNFLHTDSLLNNVRQEFYELDWNNRNMDLYEFFQSKDLKYLNQEHITNIYNFLKTDVMKWVADLTGYELTHMSATCSLYSNTDYLLVHDDQREDRMVAFVLYLTDSNGWDESKGGALQLLNKNEDNQSEEVVKNIFPCNNQLVLFPVTSDSYHQVGEVTCKDSCRLSINGWFHSKVPPVFETPVYKPLAESLYADKYLKAAAVDIDLESWINEEYLNNKSIKQIQQLIEDNSEISLRNFLRKQPFDEVLKTLANEDIKWKKIGPPNRYSYEIIDLENLPHVLDRFISLFQSVEMFSLLHRYTDLDLNGENASMKFEVQRWTPGSYSLLTDYDWQSKNELDLILYFGCKHANDVIGARTQYVTIEDEVQNALITVEPEENNLNIVYRDSARFTKYFSKQSKCKVFYTLMCSYLE